MSLILPSLISAYSHTNNIIDLDNILPLLFTESKELLLMGIKFYGLYPNGKYKD